MPFPIVQIDSATGSDTAASGAGPATALTGTAAATDAAGTLVTLDGSPDLTNVLTDGSHVIWVNDTTANARNFASISAKDNVAKTVTVSQAFAASLSGRTWAIGGRRASIGSTTSRRLVEQTTNGDWMPGWRVRFASGHSETLSAALNLRRVGTATDGPMYFEADPAATVQPTLTWSVNVNGVNVINGGKQVTGLRLRNTNATKSGAGIIIGNAATNVFVKGNKIGESGAAWAIGVSYTNNNNAHTEIVENDIGFNATGISLSSTTFIGGNDIHDCSSHGVLYGGGTNGFATLYKNAISNIGGDAVRTATAITGLQALGNTIHGVTGDAFNILDVTLATEHISIYDNNVSNIGGYGIDWAVTAEAAAFVATQVRFNNFFSCTLGVSNPSGLAISDGTNINPNYVSSGTRDFTPTNSGITSQGFPATLGAAINHAGIGAIQPSGGGAPGLLNIRGGFVN